MRTMTISYFTEKLGMENTGQVRVKFNGMQMKSWVESEGLRGSPGRERFK